MGCCESRDSDEEGLTSVRVERSPSRGNAASNHRGSASRNSSASRLPKSTPSRVKVGPSRVNVVPNAPSPSRAKGGLRYQLLAANTVSDNSCIWDQIRPAQSYYPQPPEDHDEVESIGRSSQHNEERHFFQIFFSVLDQVPGHKGIFKRWKKEAQRAESENAAGRTNMSKVWNEPAGYVKTLQRIKMLVHNKGFQESDRAKLAEWSAKVVRRRTAQYNKAAAQGKEDSKHLKVLEEWRGVNSTIQNLL